MGSNSCESSFSIFASRGILNITSSVPLKVFIVRDDINANEYCLDEKVVLRVYRGYGINHYLLPVNTGERLGS